MATSSWVDFGVLQSLFEMNSRSTNPDSPPMQLLTCDENGVQRRVGVELSHECDR